MDLRSPGPVPSIALSWLSPQDACFCSARGHPTAMTSILVLQSSKVTQVFASPTTPGPRSVSFWHCPLGFCSLLLLAPQGSSQAAGLPWLPSPLRTPTLPVNPGHLRGRPLPSIRLFSSGGPPLAAQPSADPHAPCEPGASQRPPSAQHTPLQLRQQSLAPVCAPCWGPSPGSSLAQLGTRSGNKKLW